MTIQSALVQSLYARRTNPNVRLRLAETFSLLMLAIICLSGAPALGQVSISLQANDGAAIPNSQRSFYANITGTTNLGVNWTVSGGCSLSSSTGTPVIVTAPATGGKCVASTTNAQSFTSPVSCTITATAQDTSNGLQSSSTNLPVCAPSVMLSVFPASTVLYKGQYAVLQSDLRGSTNTDVTWTVSTNPGSLGSISGGTTNRQAIFSASGPGTYTVTATSVADKTKVASATVFVTANALPSAARTDHTEAVDCTAVGSGKTYEVGPARAYTDLNMIPWDLVTAGDTVRIHNDDTTGSKPTVYNQRVSIASSGNATQPVRICGVPDASGIKPIIDASGSTTRSDENWASGYLDGSGIITLYDGAHKGDAAYDQNTNVLIEGLHIRNANPSYNYIAQSGGASTPWGAFSACVWVQNGLQVMVRGNEFDNCAQGVFSNATTPEGALVQDLTVEGNYTHGYGVNNVYTSHGMYLQAIGLTVQFNYFGAATTGTLGNVIKSRSVLNFLRWNYISQPTTTTARAFDMVEPQAFNCYIIPQHYAKAYLGGLPSDCGQPYHGGDTLYTADTVAANYEAYHSDYIYGNVMDDSGSGSGYIHYGYDQQTPWAPEYDRRGGTLYSWNNTHLSRIGSGEKIITETTAPDQGHSYEFPAVRSINNIYGGKGVSFSLNYSLHQVMEMNTNWLLQGYGLPWKINTDTYMGAASPAELATCSIYGSCTSDNGHLLWSRNNVLGSASSTLYTGTAAPFDLTTFVPTSTVKSIATTLPAAIVDQPSNMEYFPATSVIMPRADTTYLGALDTGSGAPAITAPAPVVTKPAAALTLNPSSSVTVMVGRTLKIEALVSGNVGMPTGNVTFSLGNIGFAMPLSSAGLSSFMLPPSIPAGTYTIHASYAGDKTYTSGAPMATLTVLVKK